MDPWILSFNSFYTFFNFEKLSSISLSYYKASLSSLSSLSPKVTTDGGSNYLASLFLNETLILLFWRMWSRSFIPTSENYSSSLRCFWPPVMEVEITGSFLFFDELLLLFITGDRREILFSWSNMSAYELTSKYIVPIFTLLSYSRYSVR